MEKITTSASSLTVYASLVLTLLLYVLAWEGNRRALVRAAVVAAIWPVYTICLSVSQGNVLALAIDIGFLILFGLIALTGGRTGALAWTGRAISFVLCLIIVVFTGYTVFVIGPYWANVAKQLQ